MKGSLECPLHIIEPTQLRFLALELRDSQQPGLGEAQPLYQNALSSNFVPFFCGREWVLSPLPVRFGLLHLDFGGRAGVTLWGLFWECKECQSSRPALPRCPVAFPERSVQRGSC